MAYVFGIEGVPIFEMLLVICILLMVGLFFILLELKKLTALISKENTDINRFEGDLSEFEKDTGKRSTVELINYVKDSMGKGLSRSQIEVSLLQRGWPRQEIERILNTLDKK